jgi:hypothetical protein
MRWVMLVMSWVKRPRGLSRGELGDELGDEPTGFEWGLAG